jgi:nuclear pore complex protein Nup155
MPNISLIATLLPLLERYAFEFQRDVGPASWVVDTFLDIGVPYETILPVLESMFYNDETPFQGKNRRIIAKDILHVLSKWYRASARSNTALFGSDVNARHAAHMLGLLQQNGLDGGDAEACRLLKLKLEAELR